MSKHGRKNQQKPTKPMKEKGDLQAASNCSSQSTCPKHPSSDNEALSSSPKMQKEPKINSCARDLAKLSQAMFGINPTICLPLMEIYRGILAILCRREDAEIQRKQSVIEEETKSKGESAKKFTIIELLNAFKQQKSDQYSNLSPENLVMKVIDSFSTISGTEHPAQTILPIYANNSATLMDPKAFKLCGNFKGNHEFQSQDSGVIILQRKGWTQKVIPESFDWKECKAGCAVLGLCAVVVVEKDKNGSLVCFDGQMKGRQYSEKSFLVLFYKRKNVETISKQTQTDELVARIRKKGITTIEIQFTSLLQKPKPASPIDDQIPDRLAARDMAVSTESSEHSSSENEGQMQIEFKDGLFNLGNTCFMNAALNGVYSLRSFRTYFTPALPIKQDPLLHALYQFCNKHTQEPVQSDVLYRFKNAIPEFSDGRQHCANSYIFKLLMLLDTLIPCKSETTFPQDIFGNKSRQYRRGKCEPLHDIFSALVENLFICTECGHIRRNFSYFRTVDVPIPYSAAISGEVTVFSPHNFYPGRLASMYIGTEATEEAYRQKFLQRSTEIPEFESLPALSRTSLSQCFKYMLRASLMSAQSLMHCDDCDIETRHYKQSFFRQLSTCFVVHFQRFDERTGRKLDTPIEFPMDLDMSEYCVNDQRKYHLCGVVYHFGSLDFGHYTACIKVRGRWYNVNDSSVRKVEEEPQVENAYMLFYEE